MIGLDEDRPPPFGQEANLDLVADQLVSVFDTSPPAEAGLALIAAGLDVLPAARCATHYCEALREVRAEIDRLLAEVVQ